MRKLFFSHLTRMPKWSYRVTLTTALVAIVAVFSAFSLAPDAHAASQAMAGEQNCITIVDELHHGESSSRVLSSRCVEDNQPLVAPASYVLIMRLYSGNNWTGKYWSLYGPHPCSNTVAYLVPKTGFPNVHSFYAANHCYRTTAYTKNQFYGQHYSWNYNPKYVGAPWRSHFNSFSSAY